MIAFYSPTNYYSWGGNVSMLVFDFKISRKNSTSHTTKKSHSIVVRLSKRKIIRTYITFCCGYCMYSNMPASSIWMRVCLFVYVCVCMRRWCEIRRRMGKKATPKMNQNEKLSTMWDEKLANNWIHCKCSNPSIRSLTTT